MNTKNKSMITIETTINAPLKKVWNDWTTDAAMKEWCFASPDWHMPSVNQDFRDGGTFSNRMEAKDGSFGFDFAGTFDTIKEYDSIEITLGDGRKWITRFHAAGEDTKVTESFDPEDQNPLDMQQAGWQAILDNFKNYVESNKLIKLTFSIEINASVAKVYDTMLAADTYKTWTSIFNEGSSYEGSWDKASKILFVGTDQEGNRGGMVSTIKENKPNEFVSIEHLGVLKGDQEITSGPEVDGWAGSHENYYYTSTENGTLLKVEVDSNPHYKSYFEETYPKALEKLKQICEQ